MIKAKLVEDDQLNLYIIPIKKLKFYHEDVIKLHNDLMSDEEFENNWNKYCINENPEMELYLRN